MFVEDATGTSSSLADLPLELIERRIESLAAVIAASTAEWIELVGEFDRREGWGNTGCRSTAEWVAWRCALLPRAAREHVRVARALPELPAIRNAFSAGEPSYSKVRALTRVAAAESEAELLEMARHATAAQLERIVRAARRCTAIEADEISSLCHFSWSWNPEDGTLELSAKLLPEDGAMLLEALGAARSALSERRRQEAAEEAEERGSAEPHPEVAAPSDQLMVHIDAETLATDSPGASATGRGCSHLARGPGIAAETVRRLACDGSVVPLIEVDGAPAAIGRQRRTIPPATRRALISRDERCQFPGCERQRYVDGHHIHHWAQGGETTIENLVLLCRRHHRLVHEGGFAVKRNADGRLGWTAPDGSPLSESTVVGHPWPRRRRSTERAGPLLAGTGEKMTPWMCVEAALQAMLGPRAMAPGARAAGAPG
jgi:Domain of unknown function (DUF222)/HNH endonuclease